MAKENLWGQTGCQLPDGKLCRACCAPLFVPELSKEAGEECSHESAQGCGIFGQRNRPDRCSSFHCRIYLDGKHPEITAQGALIAARALQLGQITREQFMNTLDKIAKANNK